MTKRTTEQCLTEHPEYVRVDWEVTYSHSVYVKDGVLWIHSGDPSIGESGEVDTWWCNEHRDHLTPPSDTMTIDYT